MPRISQPEQQNGATNDIQGVLVIALQRYTSFRDGERRTTRIRAIQRVAFAVSLSIFVVDSIRVRAPALSGPRTGPFKRPWPLCRREPAAPGRSIDIRTDIWRGQHRQSR